MGQTLSGSDYLGIGLYSAKSSLSWKKPLRIVSWNVLAPELLLYFWRSSYGLKVRENNLHNYYDNQYYDKIHQRRFKNIVSYFHTYSPDIICLQEVTDIKYPYLNHKTIQQYIADEMKMEVVSESFKQSRLKYSYPPSEQNWKSSLDMDSGVAILIKNGVCQEANEIAIAENFGKSSLFKSGIGSPLNIVHLKCYNKNLYIANTHIRMNYPHIIDSLNEVYSRVKKELSPTQLKSTILVGDLNAGSLIAGRELFQSDLYQHMFDIFGHKLIDDHVFIGNRLRTFPSNVEYDRSIKLLEMNVNKPVVGKRWTIPRTKFNISEKNSQMISKGNATTDHYPILIDIDLDKPSSRRKQPSL
jgi:endonuclease/exonuclease/phosphatase family metal-dependent hydrolase